MKKILVINNDYIVAKSALNFAIQTALQESATIYGMFVHSLAVEDREGYYFPNDINLTDKDLTKATDEDEHLQYERNSIKLFEDICKTAHVPYKTHVIHDHFLDSLIDHSAFADVIVCDAQSSPLQYSVKSLMADAHCPVVLVNKDYKQTDTLVFTYDDKTSSIHAVRMFTYLFHCFKKYPVRFVSIIPNDVMGIEYEDIINEWLPLHYKNSEIVILKGDPKEELARYINNQVNPLVVMGAFGRSSFSRFFKESLANVIAKKTNAPIFITHD